MARTKVVKRPTGRPKPLVPSAGPTGRPYGNGGKIKKAGKCK